MGSTALCIYYRYAIVIYGRYRPTAPYKSRGKISEFADECTDENLGGQSAEILL